MNLCSGQQIESARLSIITACALLAVFVMLSWLAENAQGQARVAIPSSVEGGTSTNFSPNNNSGPTTFSPPVTSTPGFQTIPPTYQAPYVGGPYTAAQYNNPSPYPGYNYSIPGGTPGNGAPAVSGGATFQGGVTPAPTWDPYSSSDGSPLGSAPYTPAPYNPTPYTPAPYGQSQSPGVLFPGGFSSPYPSNAGCAPANCAPATPYQRLFREVRIEDTFLGGDGINELNWNMAEVSATAQFPFFYQQAPLLLTPGFAVNNVSTPGLGGANNAALPPRIYDAYLDTAWKPQITPFLSADLGVRVGVYSDFDHVTTDSVRIMGRGLLVMALTPTMQIAGGVVYYDRLKTKLLPAGGVIWVPNQDVRFEILFPKPKLSKRLSTVGTTEWWGYVGGEYGGGSWTVELNDGMGFSGSDRIDFNDIRIGLGLEWRCHAGMRGWIEAGYVFEREVIYQTNNNLNFDPNDTYMVRGGIAY